MAKQLQTRNKVDYFEVSITEMLINLRGFGICDSCGTEMKEQGYLIPVLNSVYCSNCFNTFEKTGLRYEEDEEYNSRKIKEFSTVLTLD